MSDEEGYEEEEASPETKLNIATYFIMSSPTGEVNSVIDDVKKLVADDSVLDDGALAKIMRGYNVEQMHAAKDPDGDDKIVVSGYGQVADNMYVDPATGRVLEFDHKKRQFTAVTEKMQVLGDEIAGYRSAIDTEIQAYIDGAYKAGKCTRAVYGSDSGDITIIVTAANVNLGNFWTGGWRGVYTLNVSSKKSVSMSGSLKVNVHYFEDGNVQLHTNLEQKADITVSDEASTAKEVRAAISKIETDFQSNLEEMYVNMHRSTFKAMRRFLPINRQPMNWNSAAHQLAGEIGN